MTCRYGFKRIDFRLEEGKQGQLGHNDPQFELFGLNYKGSGKLADHI